MFIYHVNTYCFWYFADYLYVIVFFSVYVLLLLQFQFLFIANILLHWNSIIMQVVVCTCLHLERLYHIFPLFLIINSSLSISLNSCLRCIYCYLIIITYPLHISFTYSFQYPVTYIYHFVCLCHWVCYFFVQTFLSLYSNFCTSSLTHFLLDGSDNLSASTQLYVLILFCRVL